MKSLLLLLVLVVLAAPAVAQKKLYHCGSQYQDRPCEGAKEAPKPAAAPTSAKSSPAPSRAAIEERKRIRCENYARQVDEMKQKEAASSNPEMRENMGVQRKALEARMVGESC
ncbi:MAG: hypothetical protein EXR27_09230 [Betaproteobacteria bacterium]|nr:hypothetical protein [Betaproteobacteria bacterium]